MVEVGESGGGRGVGNLVEFVRRPCGGHTESNSIQFCIASTCVRMLQAAQVMSQLFATQTSPCTIYSGPPPPPPLTLL